MSPETVSQLRAEAVSLLELVLGASSLTFARELHWFSTAVSTRHPLSKVSLLPAQPAHIMVMSAATEGTPRLPLSLPSFFLYNILPSSIHCRHYY